MCPVDRLAQSIVRSHKQGETLWNVASCWRLEQALWRLLVEVRPSPRGTENQDKGSRRGQAEHHFLPSRRFCCWSITRSACALSSRIMRPKSSATTCWPWLAVAKPSSYPPY